ncbi:hypothetical protein MKX03_020892 [Papaver bracteatum]|nr:hypothetical protein MKX03_020892 [Papaver bracteatum]
MNHQQLSPESISAPISTSPLHSPDDFQFEKSLNKYTSDQIAKAEEFEEKAGKKINGWSVFGWAVFRSNYKDAAELYKKAADRYKLSQSWEKVAETYLKVVGCYLKLEDTHFIDFKHQAARDYAHAGDIYRKISAKGVNMEIGELYEVEQKIEKAVLYFERAADLYQRYPRAIAIYEDFAKESLNRLPSQCWTLSTL